MRVWQVLVVEDDAPTREFFATAVREHPELALSAAVASVAQARAWLDAAEPPPDVLLTDLGLPDGSGLEVIAHALRRNRACEALVISMFGDDENVLASIEAGACGYIHKDSAPEDIAATILEMTQGGSPISPMIARRMLSRFRGLRERPGAADDAAAASLPAGGALSPREQEVLELIARGFSYADIARLKSVSVHTVKSHIKNLYAKLTVRSRSEAVYEATQLGLLRPPDRL